MNCYKTVIYNRHGNSLNDCSASGYQGNAQTGSFQSRKAIYFFFSPSWVAHTYLRGPWRSFQHPHCVFHIVAAITMLMLIGCSLCDPSEQKLLHSITSRVLNYCHWLSITKCWQVLRNSGRKEARAKQKIITISYWKGAEGRNLNRLAKRDAEAWGHEAWGSKSSYAVASNDRAAHMPEHFPLLSLCATAIQN